MSEHPGGPKVIPSTWQSAGTGTPNAGMALGCIVGGYSSAYLGRKMTIVVLSIISIVGVIIQCAIPVSSTIYNPCQARHEKHSGATG